MGGGISSRLFQALRERQGLAYDMESRLETYADTGLWLIRTACAPRHSQDCRAAVEHCVLNLIHTGPAPEEMAVSRRHLFAELLIMQDDADACMERLAREAIYLGQHPELKERVQRLASVTPGGIATVLGHAWREAAFVE
jgi:predicted Zn-dependent peptidase